MKKNKLIYFLLILSISVMALVAYIISTLVEFKNDIKSTVRDNIKISDTLVKLDKTWLVLSDNNPHIVSSVDGKINLRFYYDNKIDNIDKYATNLKTKNNTVEKIFLIISGKQIPSLKLKQKINEREYESYITVFNNILMNLDIDYDDKIDSTRKKALHFLSNNIKRYST